MASDRIHFAVLEGRNRQAKMFRVGETPSLSCSQLVFVLMMSSYQPCFQRRFYGLQSVKCKWLSKIILRYANGSW